MNSTAIPFQALSRYLDAGADLTEIPDLEKYARCLMKRDAIPPADREMLIDFFLDNYVQWEAGQTVTHEGIVVEPSSERMRHALWLAEGLHDDAVAERFLAALPADMRERLGLLQ